MTGVGCGAGDGVNAFADFDFNQQRFRIDGGVVGSREDKVGGAEDERLCVISFGISGDGSDEEGVKCEKIPGFAVPSPKLVFPCEH